jgi:hypothetical protein
MKRALILMLLCTACATSGKASYAVFRQPERYVDQTLTVCGYFEVGAMVYPTEKTVGSIAGIGLIDRRDVLKRYVGPGCIKGRMVYQGCGRTEICTGNGTLYMIDLTEGGWVERPSASSPYPSDGQHQRP